MAVRAGCTEVVEAAGMLAVLEIRAEQAKAALFA
jgi:hypothetical protein